MSFDPWEVIRKSEIQPRQAVTEVENRFGITVETPSVAVGQPYWKIIGLHHFATEEGPGLHHLFLDVIDENGERVDRATLIGKKGNLPEFPVVVDKPHNEPGTNIPMWSQDRVKAYVHWPAQNPLPSEVVGNVHTQHEPVGGEGWMGHHSFYVIFKKTVAGGVHEEPETDPELVRTLFEAGEPLIIPLDPQARLYRAARDHNLGERLTREYVVDFNGQKYTAQIFDKGLVYIPTGSPDNPKVIQR